MTGIGQSQERTVREGEPPTVAILIPRELRQRIFTPGALQQLATAARVRLPAREPLTAADLPELLQPAVACLTGWDTPMLDASLIPVCPSLRFIAHTAGSIHHYVADAWFEHGARVSHAAMALAESVAEFTVLQALHCLRRLDAYTEALQQGAGWKALEGQAYGSRLLSAQTVGVVGASKIGREVIARLKPFGCRLIVYDPYLGAEEAGRMGVELVDLPTLLRSSDIVSLHAPLNATTRGMIGAGELALLRDGAILLNTARGGLLDEAALIQTLLSERIVAALDVLDEEPPPPDFPLYHLPNVIITPHIAGATVNTLHKQGQTMVDEVCRFLRGEPLHFEVNPTLLPVMA